jgi:aspartyl-tRNA(Asn)/glutamyl-tRNA(Gln) amidotransferase subunit B
VATVAVETEFRTIIGLEVHAQVLTRSKMFCGCSADYASAESNTHVCPVCMGLPGALPVINRAAIETVVLTGLALGCEIPGFSKFDRKNYFYPDLPKGYQISQYDLPLCVNGTVTFESEAGTCTVGITRVHLEEDTGRLLHRVSEDSVEVSLVDLNRSGVPLMEIVGEPDLFGPAQARDYLVALRQILRYVGASTGNMEEGAFRCDANVSSRSVDGSRVGEKVEIKNMNSFRAVERALRFEEVRQRALLTSGRPVPQETRGWVETQGITVSQRTKESAHDYRYFPEPDLPPLAIDAAFVASIRDRLPELPAERRERFMSQYGLGLAETQLLTLERRIADYFEEVIAARPQPSYAKIAANWILNDLFALQRERGLAIDQLPVEPGQLRDLLDLVETGDLTNRSAKELIIQLQPSENVRGAAERLQLISLDDEEPLLQAARAVLEANPAAVADYRRGKTASIGRLIGETMRATGGRGRPDTVRAILEDLLTN